MNVRKLAVEGALEFTPEVFSDDRGLVVSPFQRLPFSEVAGGSIFPVAQTIHSESRRGVIRGIHYTVTPPGMAKYAYCARGEALYIVVDIRVGSPTFGQWDSALMDQKSFRSMYFPVGVGNGFIALTEGMIMSYMISQEYVPNNEKAIAVMDPELGLPIPDNIEPILSERDRLAITLFEAMEANLLPQYDQTKSIERSLISRQVVAGTQ